MPDQSRNQLPVVSYAVLPGFMFLPDVAGDFCENSPSTELDEFLETFKVLETNKSGMKTSFQPMFMGIHPKKVPFFDHKVERSY